MKEKSRKQIQHFRKIPNFRKSSRGPWEAPGVPWEAHGKIFEDFCIFRKFWIFSPRTFSASHLSPGAWGGLHTVPQPKTSNPRASPELKIQQKSIKNHDSSSSSSSSSSTVEGQNAGTPFLLIIPEGARARVRTRTRVRARTICCCSALRCHHLWSWP